MITLSHAGNSLSGRVSLPASKSIANRLLLIRAVAGLDKLAIHNLSDARDTVILQGILHDFGKVSEINVHDAGTVMRFLTAYLSARPGTWKLTGAERMQQRPIGPLVHVLRSLGAQIEYEKREGFPPLIIKGAALKGGAVEIDGSVSSQFISALLMIAPLYTEPLRLIVTNQLVSAPYIQMTLHLMKRWGAIYNWEGNVITVQNRAYTAPAYPVFVESDWSAASYFYSMLALAGKGELEMPHLFGNSLQGDSVCAAIFGQLGVNTAFTDSGVVLSKNDRCEKLFRYDFINCPDIAQTLAVCCVGLGVEGQLHGLQTLAIKETDRIAAIQHELEKIGFKAGVTQDSIHIPPHAWPLPDAGNQEAQWLIKTYKDHRMAMSFAPLALRRQLLIDDEHVVEKSFPRFWSELKKLGFQVKEA